MAACGCTMVREPDGSWLVTAPEASCLHGHVVGLRGWIEGEPLRVPGVGECVTLVFERASRTAMLMTPADAHCAVAETHLATPTPRKAM